MSVNQSLKRRDFLAMAGGLLSAFFGRGVAALTAAETTESLAGIKPPELPKVPLGKTGYKVTRVGMGGAEVADLPVPVAIRLVQDAYRAGITYFDTASSYGDGKSETVYGQALKEVRNKIVIATKTLKRRRDRADQEIEESLRRLQVEVLDILQIHSINTIDEWRMVSSPEGSLRAAEKFKEAGQVRHIGITGHRQPEVLLTALEEYPFSTVLIPISAADAGFRDFGEVVDYARSKGIGVIAMKVLAAGKLVKALNPRDCLRYALSRGVDTAIVGFTEKSHIDDAVTVAKEVKGWTKEQRFALEERAKPFANPSYLWWKRD